MRLKIIQGTFLILIGFSICQPNPSTNRTTPENIQSHLSSASQKPQNVAIVQVQKQNILDNLLEKAINRLKCKQTAPPFGSVALLQITRRFSPTYPPPTKCMINSNTTQCTMGAIPVVMHLCEDGAGEEKNPKKNENTEKPKKTYLEIIENMRRDFYKTSIKPKPMKTVTFATPLPTFVYKGVISAPQQSFRKLEYTLWLKPNTQSKSKKRKCKRLRQKEMNKD